MWFDVLKQINPLIRDEIRQTAEDTVEGLDDDQLNVFFDDIIPLIERELSDEDLNDISSFIEFRNGMDYDPEEMEESEKEYWKDKEKLFYEMKDIINDYSINSNMLDLMI